MNTAGSQKSIFHRGTGSVPAHGVAGTLVEAACRLIFRLYFRLVHRIVIEGMENVPSCFDRLIVIANHASLIDGVLIWTYLRLPFKIIVDRATAQKPLFRSFLQNRFTVPIDSMNPYSLKEVIRWVEEGAPLLIFPEGRITRTGSLMKIYEGTGFVALKTGARILPIHLEGTYGTIFARKHRGRKIFASITVTVGKTRDPISLDYLPNRTRKQEATRMVYRILSEIRLEARNKPATLGVELIRRCRENGGRPLFHDATGARVTYRQAFMAAFVLGRCLSRHTESNVGLMLPNLTVTALIFMGLQIFRKVPAFLNYSSGPRGLGQAIDLAGLNVIVTSRQFLERTRIPETLFAGRNMVFVEDLKGQIRLHHKIEAFLRSLFPGRHGRIKAEEHRETACILFTSGSEGDPKGVCLSHENIITNVHQALTRIDVTENDYFLSALPVFHSFGLTVGMIIPIFLNARAFFYVNPLHYRIIPEIAYEQECTILCGTNTFLNGYGKRADPYDFSSMRYIFCGAEPLGEEVFERFAKKFGVRVMSGYGATECSPIISIGSALEHEYGTVGTILPGMEHKLLSVDGIDDKGGSIGRLFVRGKNVMKGYLKNEKANHKYLVEDQGWYDTGDIVEITHGGFLKIVGRLKRFAKIGGEMISLPALEETLAGRFGDRNPTAVISLPDEQRGEKLVVVTSNPEVELKTVQEILKTKGFSDLAIPRELSFVKDIPKLGTGKVDYPKVREMVWKQLAL